MQAQQPEAMQKNINTYCCSRLEGLIGSSLQLTINVSAKGQRGGSCDYMLTLHTQIPVAAC